MSRPYDRPDLHLARGGSGGGSDGEIRALQRDLRQLGYLKRGIDGDFGGGTERAVRALQHDLIHNDGSSTARDGAAPVAVTSYNRARVSAIDGVVRAPLAGCIDDMLADPAFVKIPESADPAGENARIARAIAALDPEDAPIPFLIAILTQESGLKHFNEPRPGDDDRFITIGLDTNDKSAPDAITSRGYGAGQYTLFHHPPRSDEVSALMLDPARNLAHASGELGEKFIHFINGATGGTQADDRLAEFGAGPLRRCKHDAADPRFMRDCLACVRTAPGIDIKDRETPFHPGTAQTYRTTQYYRTGDYADIPDRAALGCDWPYAVRRYNGSGPNSYHYQVRVLRHMRDAAETG